MLSISGAGRTRTYRTFWVNGFTDRSATNYRLLPQINGVGLVGFEPTYWEDQYELFVEPGRFYRPLPLQSRI